MILVSHEVTHPQIGKRLKRAAEPRIDLRRPLAEHLRIRE